MKTLNLRRAWIIDLFGIHHALEQRKAARPDRQRAARQGRGR